MENGKKTGGDKKNAILHGLVGVLAIAVIIQGVMLYQANCCPMTGKQGRGMGPKMKDKGGMCPFMKGAKKEILPSGSRMQNPQAASMWDDDSWAGSWDPFLEIEMMQQRINRMFSHSLRKMTAIPDFQEMEREMSFQPDLDITEEGDFYVISYDIPGMDKSKINVEVKDQSLTVFGERSVSQEEKNQGFYKMERSFGSFSRSVPLPENADLNDVQAQYINGVLTIRVKKLKGVENRDSLAKPVQVQ